MRHLRHGILALGFSLALSLPALADPGDGGMVYYSPGFQLINTEPLNSQIPGYQPVNSLFWGQGGGLVLAYHRFMLGAEFHSLFGQLTQNNTDSLRVEGAYGLLHLGYAVFASSRFQFFPYVGIGPGLVNLYGSDNLSSLLQVSQGSNQQVNQLQGASLLLDFGVAGNVILPMSPENTEDQRGPAIGLRLGYLVPVTSTAWQSNRLPVSGGPELMPGGFYLKLTAGFGSFQ